VAALSRSVLVEVISGGFRAQIAFGMHKYFLVKVACLLPLQVSA